MTSEREAKLVESITETSRGFYLAVTLLAAVVLWGAYAYFLQLRQGLIVTGMRDQVSWGLYITNFVFFIGISHAGTLISAILRVTHATWRQPITRLAEAITVFALCIGAPMVIIDLGRPERIPNLLRYARIQSPILWDVLSITTYLTGCILYLYIPMIPDLGVLAQRPGLPAWRRRLYGALSLGWTGSAEQHQLLEKAITVMAVVIIPLAVSVHTVVSWIFAMTLRPGWNSSIFGPYFVIGAIYSGAAAVVLSMYVVRRVLRLEAYLEPLHFRNLGLLLLAFSLLYFYFNVNEYLTVGYKMETVDRLLLEQLFFGNYAPLFWTVQAIGVILPLLLLLAVLAVKRYEPFVIPGVALAAFFVVVGAWAKRYIIVIPTLASPYLPAQRVPWDWTHYRPTWVEWSITAAAFAVFLLIYLLFLKLFPIVSIWETREAKAPGHKVEAEVPPLRQRWGSVSSLSLLLLASVLVGAGAANAREPRPAKAPKPTTLAVEWKAIENPQDTSDQMEGEQQLPGNVSRVPFSLGRAFGQLTFGSKPAKEEQKPRSQIAVTATLLDEMGAPVSFQPLAFSLKTSFGLLRYGNRPTDQEGKAQLVVGDQRYGKYVIQVAYGGSEDYGAHTADVMVDFGPRPAPGLPRQGVLITPYMTAIIGLPFLLFYGVMWVVFFYAFGYTVLWKMRRSGSSNRRA